MIFAVVGLAVINVEVQTAGGGQNAVRLFQPGAQEALVVVKIIGVLALSHLDRHIAVAAKALPVAVLGPHGLDLRASLDFARVEGRVNVNQIHQPRGKRLQDRQIIAKVNTIGGHTVILTDLGQNRPAVCCVVIGARKNQP